MPTHPLISILLAAWLGFGGALGPRFLCMFADGTATVEFGQQSCCYADESCGNTRCGDEIAAEINEACSGSDRCPQGCNSTMLAEEVGLLVDWSADQWHDLIRSSPVPVSCIWIEEYGWNPSLTQEFGPPRGDTRQKADVSHLRSVILLV